MKDLYCKNHKIVIDFWKNNLGLKEGTIIYWLKNQLNEGTIIF